MALQSNLTALAAFLATCATVAGCATVGASRSQTGLAASEPVVEASFTSGFFGNEWTIWISSDGHVQSTEAKRRGSITRARPPLSPESVARLAAKAESVDFYDLPTNIFVEAEDVQKFSISIVSAQGRHKVSVWGPETIVCETQPKRFLELWREIFKYVALPARCDTDTCLIECPSDKRTIESQPDQR